MEQSLESIEKSLAPAGPGMAAGASRAVGNLASMALSVSTIVKALSAKEFKKKNADTILSFVEGMAAATQDLNTDTLKSLADFSTGISSFMKTMSDLSMGGIVKIMLFQKLLFSGKNSVLKQIVSGAMDAVSSYSMQDMEKMHAAAQGISIMAEGLMKLGKALAVWALLAVAAPLVLAGAVIAGTVVKMFLYIASKSKDVEEGSKAIGVIGKGLITLAAGLAVMGLLVTYMDFTKMMAVIGVVAALSLTFAMIGKASESITQGSKAVKGMGVALMVLSAGIALLSLVIMLVPPKILLEGLLVVAAYGLVFALIGRASQFIAKGALVMILGLSVGLFFFSGALLLFGMALEKITIGKAMLGIALIFGMGAVFSFLGAAGPLIEEGAFVMGLMGISLIVFSGGMLIFALALKGVIALFKNDWEVAALATAGIILGLGLVIAGIGLLSPAIAPGALVLALMGASLAVFAVGLIAFSLVLKGVMALFKNDWEEAKNATTEIILGMGKLFAVMGVMSPLVALGSVAVLTVGAALLVFSVGLMTFALATKLVKSLGLLEEKGDGYEFMGTSIIKSIVNGVISVGGPIKAIRAMMGAATMIAVGGALMVFSLGLAATSKVIDKIPTGFTDTLFDEDNGLIPEILGSFKKIGKDYGSFLSFGSDPVSMGVKVVKKASSALSELAGGIAAFAKVDRIPVKIPDKNGNLKWSEVSLSTTLANIRTVMVGDDGKSGILLTMAKVFGEIGNMPEVTGVPSGQGSGAGGFFKRLLNRMTGDTPMLRGMRAVSQIGDVLQSLAGGITAFANVDEIPVQVPDAKDPSKLVYRAVKLSTVLSNLSTVLIGPNEDGGILLSLTKIFAKIGNMPAVTGIPEGENTSGVGGFFRRFLNRITGDTPMLRGIKAVSQIGDVISTLAGGITAFANVDEIPVQVPDAKDPSKLIYKSVSLDEVVANIQTVLLGDGIGGARPGLLMSLADVFAKIARDYPSGFFEDNDVKKGASRVKEVADAIGGISQTVLAFAELEKMVPIEFDKDGKPTKYSKIDQASIRANIISFIQTIPSAFATLNMDMLEKAKDNAEEYESITDAISKLANPVKTLSEALTPKQKDQKGPLTMLSEELGRFLAFLSANPINDAVISGLNKLYDSLNKFSSMNSPFSGFVSSFNKFNDTFASFSGNMGKFADNFKKLSPLVNNYQKFAGLLNGHAVYASRFAIWEPAFGRMSSKDLEDFAKNFKSMDVKAIDAFRIWTEALTNFVKVDPNTFETIAEKLEKVINAPLNVEARRQEGINSTFGNGGIGSGMFGNAPTPEGANTLQNTEKSNEIFERVTSRYNNDIAALRADIAAMTQQIQILSSRLTSSEGINVRVVR
jgi:hypothetical protein